MRIFLIALRFALVEHARNRLALILILGFVPLWISLGQTVISEARSSGEAIGANGNHLTGITAALNAVTLIAGFMMFAVTFASGHLDQRLALAGFPRTPLVLAKVCALIALAAVISCYATGVILLYWQPHQVWLLTLGLFTAALTYGAFGVLLATVLRGEVEAMFLIIMVSIIDNALQNPILNPEADFVGYLPSFGAMQTATAASFSDTVPWGYVALELGWFTVAAFLGLMAFHRRTRDHQATAPALA